MSAMSIDQAANDPDLRKRVLATIFKIMAFDDAKAASDYGMRVRQGSVNLTPAYFVVAVETESAYASALTTGRGAPGHDTDVISDADIESALVASWPPDPATFVAAPALQGLPQGLPKDLLEALERIDALARRVDELTARVDAHG